MHHTRDLFKKLRVLKQGTETMEIAIIRANVKEPDLQTMARFLNGLNHPIKRIADFQPYNYLLELVHQATKTKQQVQDVKYSKSSYTPRNFNTNTQASPSTVPYTRTTPTSGALSSSTVPATSPSRPPSAPKPRNAPAIPSTVSTKNTSKIECFTCKGRNHKSF